MFMLKQIRELKGLTLKELADRIEQTEGSVSHYESGRRMPNYETLLKLSDALNCSIDSICGNNFALTNEEEQLLFFFRELNDLGKRQLLKQASIFSQDEDFSQKNNTDTHSISA